MTTAAAIGLAGLVVATTGAPTPAGALAPALPITGRASTGPKQAVANDVDSGPVMDASGRYIAFSTSATLTADDTYVGPDVYLRDRLAGTTTLVNLTTAGKQATGGINDVCAMSRDARYVVFWSNSALLPSGASIQLYERDRQTHTTAIVSLNTFGNPETGGTGPAANSRCAVSDDGRYVAWASTSTNLVANDTNSAADVFERDRQSATTTRISVDSGGGQVSGASLDPQMSADGTAIAFTSESSGLVVGDTNGARDVFVRKPASSTTVRASVNGAGQQLVGGASQDPTISSNGRYVAFDTEATNAFASDTNGFRDIVLRDVLASTTELISQSSTEVLADGDSLYPAISSDGRFVAFASSASNLNPALSGNLHYQIEVRDRQAGLTYLHSRVGNSLTAGNLDSVAPAVSDDGQVTAFVSHALNLAPGDASENPDVYFHDQRFDSAPFGSLADSIDQQELDFANRAATDAEQTTTQARFVHGEASLDQVIADLAHTNGWAGRRAPVTRLYWAFFLRIPDQGGLDFWVSKLAAGKTLAWVASQFALSNEFKTTYGSLSNASFVKLVYENVLQREPDAAGAAYWKGQLDSNAKTRGDCMVGFSESAEGKAFLAPQVDTVLVYLGMLRAMPSAGSFTTAVASMKGGQPLAAVIRAIRLGAAYSARVS